MNLVLFLSILEVNYYFKIEKKNYWVLVSVVDNLMKWIGVFVWEDIYCMWDIMIYK